MKRAILASVATLTFAATAAFLTGSVSAQDRGEYFSGRPDDGWGASRGMPGGSWRESCRFPNMRGPVLVAQCRTSYDRWVRRGSIRTPAAAAASPMTRAGWCARDLATGAMAAVGRFPTDRGGKAAVIR